MSDKTIRELQSSLPWTVHYHRDFRANPQAHKDFEHALLHVLKAAGVLAAIVNEAEHGGHDFPHKMVAPYVADMVVCALRMANTCPNGVIDLQKAVETRITTKNEVEKLAIPKVYTKCAAPGDVGGERLVAVGATPNEARNQLQYNMGYADAKNGQVRGPYSYLAYHHGYDDGLAARGVTEVQALWKKDKS